MSSLVSAQKIQKIQVLGNNRIESESILEKMDLKVSSELNGAAVRKDILSIFEMGYFQDIRFSEDSGVLSVQVKERPVLVDISFEGNSVFSDEDLKEALALKAYKVLNVSELKEATQKIISKYAEKSYFLSFADYEIIPRAKKTNEVDVVFKIIENNKVKIRKIFFLGNKAFSSQQLKKFMLSKEGNALSFMSQSGTYRTEFFERDLAALNFFYANEGYVESKISKPRVTVSQDKRYIDIIVEVNEGRQFKLNSLTFSGDLDYSEEELKKEVELKAGAVFSTGKVQKSIQNLTNLYGDLGYAYVNVLPQPKINSEDQSVDLNFNFDRGQKVYWGDIRIVGNSKTHDKVIRRELLFSEGELYNSRKREKSFNRVRRLGFFSENTKFITKSPDGKKDRLDLEIRVEEKQTGTLNVSAGYQTGSQFVFTGGVSQNNLFGLGQKLALNANLSTNNSSTFSLDFSDPKIFDTEWFGGIRLFRSVNKASSGQDVNNKNNSTYAFSTESTGGKLSLGKDFYENWFLLGQYRFDYTERVDPISPVLYSNGNDDKYTVVSSLSTDLIYDTRNNRLDPSNGWYFSTGLEFAGLGGRAFQAANLSLRFYKTLFWKFVYRARLEGAIIENVFDSHNIPDSEKHLLGGVTSMRGYNPATVGPVIKNVIPTRSDLLTPSTQYDVVIGGSRKLFMNHEVEFPLIPDANIRFAAFFDVGNAWGASNASNPSNQVNGIDDMLYNVGMGIRWYSPMGPLRFEWGIPLKDNLPFNKKGDTVFQFMIAPTF